MIPLSPKFWLRLRTGPTSSIGHRSSRTENTTTRRWRFPTLGAMTTRPGSTTPQWLGQDGLPWNILLVAELVDVPPTEVLERRAATLARRQGWTAPGPVQSGATTELLARLAASWDESPVTVGRTDTGIVVRCHHAYVDGLGLLAVLGELLGAPAHSDVRGAAERPRRSTVRALVSRLVEMTVRPPAGVAGRGAPDASGDTFATAQVAGRRGTSELAHAVVQVLSRWNAENGGRPDRLALAVGVSTVDGSSAGFGDQSGFLRLTDVQRWSRDDLRHAVRQAPLQVGGTAQGAATRRAGPLIRWASERFAGRLGSTVLVSHLGCVVADSVTGLAFYPLSGTGSGLSLGAVTLEDRTTLTLRARAARHAPAELDQLMGRLVAHLG